MKKTSIRKSMHDRNEYWRNKEKTWGEKQHHSIHNKKLRRESIHSQNDSTNTMSFETHKDHMRLEDDRYTHFTNDVTKPKEAKD